MWMYRKTRIVAVTSIILVLLPSLYVWQRSRGAPTVYLPDGSTAPLVEGQIADIRWRRFERPVQPPSSESLPKRLLAMGIWRFKLFQGKLSFPIPNPPRFVELVGNVENFPILTGKTCLLAEELVTPVGSSWISFKFGGPREWVQANLDCIRTNGASVSTFEEPYKTCSTAPCAVVVDLDTVRILPAHYLGFGPQSIPNK